MNANNNPNIFLFHRDLRLNDNTGLIQAIKNSSEIILCLILDPCQINDNPYKGFASLSFFYESIIELNKDITENGGELQVFFGDTQKIIELLINVWHPKGIYTNREYTPFGRQREREMAESCIQSNVVWRTFNDYLLVEPEMGVKADGSPYRIFTPFFKKNRSLKIAHPELLPSNLTIRIPKKSIPNQYRVNISDLKKIMLNNIDENPLAPTPGRVAALNIIKDLGKFANYDEEHDFPSIQGTTHLSPHLKFGTCSIREVYWKLHDELGPETPIIRQLYWRDFFTHIAFHFPEVFGREFLPKYRDLKWSNNQVYFDRWCNGITGFPIVDAGMRELNATGNMHNRVRMIVASFLVKDLHIDWRWGEKYFAQHLTDYDPAVNNGNWQWAASTGCDAQPYFRIFNPWTQQKRFDPQCEYIKRWIPELKEFSPKKIHHWFKEPKQSIDYPFPLLDHKIQRKIAIDQYKTLNIEE